MSALARTLNTNTMVSAKLTALGATLWVASHFDISLGKRPPPVKAGDVVTDTLWHFMAVFGPHLHHGMPETPFVDNNLVFHIE